MLKLVKNVALVLAAALVALVIYLASAASPHREIVDESDPPLPVHSHHGGGGSSPHAAGDQTLTVTIAKTEEGTGLSLGSAGQSAPSSLPEILGVLGNYSSEGSSVDLLLSVEGEVPFSSIQEVIDPAIAIPHVHIHLADKYHVTPAK